MHTAFFEVGCMHNEEPTRGIVVIDAVTVIVGSDYNMGCCFL